MTDANDRKSVNIPESGLAYPKNKAWRVRFVHKGNLPKNAVATCNYDRKIILVYRGLGFSAMLAALIHEAVHAAAPYLDEQSVQAIERGVANIIKPVVAPKVKRGKK